MASSRVVNALVLLQLLLVCSSIAVYGHEVEEPVKPPVKPPVTPPAYPPVKPPVHAPVKPPTHPPVKPPVHPPVKPPVKPPTYPPVKPPVHPPVNPPTHPPVKPPVHPSVKPPTYPPLKPPPPMKMIAVQGVVYCKTCKYRGVDTLVGEAPLAGAVVKLQCNNTKYGLVEQTITDKNGYFFFVPQKLTTADYQSCRVFLVSSPLSKCSVPTNLNGGANSAVLVPASKPLVTIAKKTKQPSVFFNVGPFAFEPDKKFKCHY